MSGSSVILWGWQAVPAYLNVSVDTARKPPDRENLPVSRGAGRMVQSAKAVLEAWAKKRALGSN